MAPNQIGCLLRFSRYGLRIQGNYHLPIFLFYMGKIENYSYIFSKLKHVSNDYAQLYKDLTKRVFFKH
jgi:hypothetical protein